MGPPGHREISRCAGTWTDSGAGARATVRSHTVCYGAAAGQKAASAAAGPTYPIRPWLSPSDD